MYCLISGGKNMSFLSCILVKIAKIELSVTQGSIEKEFDLHLPILSKWNGEAKMTTALNKGFLGEANLKIQSQTDLKDAKQWAENFSSN